MLIPTVQNTKRAIVNRGGAPRLNRNNMRHGLRAGRLPKGASAIKRDCDCLRRAIEAAVVEREGEVSLYAAACIQTACRWERHAMLCQRWLRLEAESMTSDQRLAYSRDIAHASRERDKCLAALGLNRKADVLSLLYGPVEPIEPATPPPSQPPKK